MKNLIYILSLITLISCSDSSTGIEKQEQFEPFTIGNWIIESDTEAEMFQTSPVLSKSNNTTANIDTTSVLTLDSLAIDAVADTSESLVRLNYTDSTLTFTEYNKVDLRKTIRPTRNLTISGSSSSLNSDRFKHTFRVRHRCLDESSLLGQEVIGFQLITSKRESSIQDTTFTKINLAGADSTFAFFLCN